MGQLANWPFFHHSHCLSSIIKESTNQKHLWERSNPKCALQFVSSMTSQRITPELRSCRRMTDQSQRFVFIIISSLASVMGLCKSHQQVGRQSPQNPDSMLYFVMACSTAQGAASFRRISTGTSTPQTARLILQTAWQFHANRITKDWQQSFFII